MTDHLTDQQLTDIAARAGAATPGPWFVHPDWPGRVFSESEFNAHVARVTGSNPESNEEFIAHARTDVPVLLAEIRRLQAELAKSAKDVDWLRCLEAAGVDNWEGIDTAIEMRDESATP